MHAAAAWMRRSGSPAELASSRSRAATRRSALALAGLALLAAGCAPAHGPAPAVPPPAPVAAPAAPAPPTRPRPRPGYDGMRDTLAASDARALLRKRIVLDPGHGGFFTGAIGPGGLTEAEVNLGVAQKLAALLGAQGATVLLTRDRDRDYLTPADSSLRADLAERVRIANAFHPDLFLSIHHNADPGGAHDVNESQVYYQLGDDGPSYDVANDVMRSLARNVGIDVVRLLPGNYFVVRGSEAPALLTETSYLTDPDVEAKLRTEEARAIEARALEIGIARFFARKAPVVESFAVLGGTPTDARIAVREREPRFAARVRGAFDAAELRIDGEPARVSIARGTLRGRPRAPLAAGPHEAALNVRLAGEGAARTARLRFEVRPLPAEVAIDAPLQPEWDGRSSLAVRIRVRDAERLPCGDSLRVRVHALGARGIVPADTTVLTHAGVAWAYVRPRHALHGARLAFSATVAGVRTHAAGEPGLAIVPHASASRAAFALAMPGERRFTRGELRDPGAAEWLTPDGFAVLPLDSAGAVHVPRLAGFRGWGPDTTWPPRWTPIAGGALSQRRIVLDPEGGGDDAAGIGHLGTRAASLNLEVARALAGLLRAAGAEVLLTRTGDAAVSEVERVQLAEGFRADRYLRIGHAAAPPVIGHYFASSAGRRWGEHVAAEIVALGGDSVRVAEVAKYALTQASSTALYVSLARIDSAAAETRLLAPGAVRAESYALFLALAREFTPDADWPLDSLVVADQGGSPLGGAPVVLGNALVLSTDAAGTLRFRHTEAGPIEVLVQDPRASWREVLLDFARGRTLSGAR